MSRKLWIALAIAVGVLALGATTASAHTWRANTNIELDSVSIIFNLGNHIRVEGNLNSPRDRCERGRFVTLWAVDTSPNPDRVTFVDADFSNASGEFVLQGDFPDGADTWVVRVNRQNVGQGGHRHICRGDTHVID